MFAQVALSCNLDCWTCLETKEREFRIFSEAKRGTPASVDVTRKSKPLSHREGRSDTTNVSIPFAATLETEVDKAKKTRKVLVRRVATTHAPQHNDAMKPTLLTMEGHPSDVSISASVCSSSSRGGSSPLRGRSSTACPDAHNVSVITSGTKTLLQARDVKPTVPVAEKCHLRPVGVNGDPQLCATTNIVGEKRKRGRPRKKPL